MAEVTIRLGERSYPVLIGSGLLGDPDSWAAAPAAASAMIVTNTTIEPLYAADVARALEHRHRTVHTVVLPDGEQHKTWATLDRVFDALLAKRCDRGTVVYALGGGVVGDIAGLAAATYMRGIPYVQLPTTLLAQVDSSVGGKTAINHPLGKNMIGAFHQPRLVVCDLDTLATLPPRELAAGLAEVIKYGPIADMDFFRWLESSMDALLRRDSSALTHAVRRSCEIKAMVVGTDEREEGLRAILNFGHTFGHAIEAALGFGTWLHGEAVACGMVMAAHLSERLGMASADFAVRLTTLLRRAGLPVRGPAVDPDRLIELMRLDKKSQAGDIRFVLIEQPGRAAVRGAPPDLVREVIQSCSG